MLLIIAFSTERMTLPFTLQDSCTPNKMFVYPLNLQWELQLASLR